MYLEKIGRIEDYVSDVDNTFTCIGTCFVRCIRWERTRCFPDTELCNTLPELGRLGVWSGNMLHGRPPINTYVTCFRNFMNTPRLVAFYLWCMKIGSRFCDIENVARKNFAGRNYGLSTWEQQRRGNGAAKAANWLFYQFSLDSRQLLDKDSSKLSSCWGI